MAKTWSTFAIAKVLNVDPGSVANWIDQELLKAHRTPGGHRRVSSEDLLDFLRRRKMPVPQELATTPDRVLVVDDERAVATFVARAIRQAFPDCEVYEAYDGFAAGTMVATLKPDVVILDLRMPGLDGYEVCRMIKGKVNENTPHVIAMTAYPSFESEKRILECGARICLSKPLDVERLGREVAACLAKPSKKS